MKLLIKQQILLAFVFALLILLALGFFSYQSSQSFKSALKREEHTRKILLNLSELKSDILDSETRTRGFFITGKEEYIESLPNLKREVEDNISQVRTLVQDNEKQKNELAVLEKLMREKFDILQKIIELRREGNMTNDIIRQRGNQLTEEIRASIARMNEEEGNLLQMRNTEIDNAIWNTFAFLFFFIGAGIVSLGLANFVIFREINKRNQAEEELSRSNIELEKRVQERTKELSGKNEELEEQIHQREYTENLHTLALAAGDLGTWLLENETENLTLDERTRSILGLGDEDCLGKKTDFFRNIHSEDLAAIEEIFQKAAAENLNINARFRLMLKDGSVRWVHCTGQPHRNGAFRFIGNCRDVTEQEELAETIRQSEAFTRSILDSLPAHIAVINKNGEIVAVNRAWEKFAENNCLPEHLNLTGIGQNYVEICKNIEVFNGEKNHIFDDLHNVLNRNLEHFSVEYPCHAPDEERWFIMNVNALNDENGGAVISHINITDRKLAENELKNSEEFSRSIFENSPDCVKVLELDGTLHSMNKNGLCIMEIDDFENVKGKQWIDFWKGDDNESAYQAVKNAREGQICSFEGFCRTAKGNPKWWEVSVAPIFGSDGKPVRLISTSRDVTERREYESALHRNKSEMEFVLEVSKLGRWTLDLSNNHATRSLRHDQIFGYEKLLPKWTYEMFLEHVLPEFRDEVDKRFKKAIKDREEWDFETKIKRADGNLRWIHARGQIQEDVGGGLKMHGTVADITDRKVAENELKNSEEFSRSIFENSPDCVKVLELDGTLHSMNKNGLCIMEIDDFENIKGKQWTDFWKGKEQAVAVKSVEAARQGNTAHFEGFANTAKGTSKYWDVTVAPIFDNNGKPRRIISTSRDITERRQAERVRAYLASIVESSNDAIISKDLNGIITSWNKGAENLFGYTAQEVIGQPITIIIPPDRIDEETKIINSIRRGEKVISLETVRQRKDQTLVEISVTISPILDNAGNIIGASKTAHDITQRKKIEAEREKLLVSEQAARKDAEIANRLRDEFLATVSHELRAPLNSILGWARLMEKGTLDQKTMEKAVSTIVRNSEAQNRLIEDLLDVSRIISGKLRLEVITVKPILFVEAALETARPAADAKNITLEIIEDPVVSHISGDPTRLQQVMWNLLSNAIKFTPKGGKVTVSISRPNGQVEISVKDTGVGIKEDFLPHVFDRFRQADASSIRKYGGLGLGLAIVRHITEMHGGTVRVESEGENMGATFTISLPVIQSEDKADSIEINNYSFNENSAKLDLKGLLILVVDDEPDSCQLLVQALTLHGATVITANSAAEGLQELIDKSPDVLVSDIGMPDEDGYSLIKKIRSLEDKRLRNITAVALTAFTRAQDRMRALAAGFNNHVGKPVEPDELATVIASLTGKLETGGED